MNKNRCRWLKAIAVLKAPYEFENLHNLLYYKWLLDD